MRKILFLVGVIMLFAACSKNEDEKKGEEQQFVQDVLPKKEVKVIDLGNGVETTTIEYTVTSGRLTNLKVTIEKPGNEMTETVATFSYGNPKFPTKPTLIKKVKGDIGEMTINYDDEGKVASLIDGVETITFTYDENKRIVKKYTQKGSEESIVNFTYEENQMTETEGNNKTIYTFDKKGNVHTVTKYGELYLTIEYDDKYNYKSAEVLQSVGWDDHFPHDGFTLRVPRNNPISATHKGNVEQYKYEYSGDKPTKCVITGGSYPVTYTYEW